MRPRSAWIAVLLVACSGELGEPAAGPSTGPERPPGPPGTPGVCTPVASRTPMRRLSRYEYGNTVSALFGVSPNIATGWPTDATGSGFDNDVDGQGPTAALLEQAMRSAEVVADAAVVDLDELVPVCATDEARCGGAILDTLGRRLYRRPLDARERASLEALYERRHGTDGRDAAARVVLMTMLQSPQFLYRIETGEGEPDAAGRVRLTPMEDASRIAFFLTAAGPDDALLDAAERGDLADPALRRAQLERLLDSEGGRTATRHFYDQWLKVERLETTRKSAELYPEWNDEVRADLLEGTRAFVEHVTLRSDEGTFTELVTSQRPFVSARLAPLYGISAEGLGETPTAVEITDHPRAGILTDMGLMAALAKVHETAPIARGVFVLEQIFCQHAPPPPNDILIEPPPPDPSLTTRERYAAHAEGSCASCHDLFDPAGFGLEGFDSLGRYRELENDLPIDTSGLLRVDGEERPFETPAELAALVAASSRARSCFAQQWFTYAAGRLPEIEDECTIDALATLVSDDAPIRAVLIALTEADAFRTRRAEPTTECR